MAGSHINLVKQGMHGMVTTAWQGTAMQIKLVAIFLVRWNVVPTCQRQRHPAPALVLLAAAPTPFWTCWQAAQLAQQQQPQTHCCHRPCPHHPLHPTCPSAAVSTSTTQSATKQPTSLRIPLFFVQPVIPISHISSSRCMFLSVRTRLWSV